MADYIKDPETGVVHVISPLGDGEFTFCDRDFGCAVDDGFHGEACAGPSTCQDCQGQTYTIKQAMKGVRFSSQSAEGKTDAS